MQLKVKILSNLLARAREMDDNLIGLLKTYYYLFSCFGFCIFRVDQTKSIKLVNIDIADLPLHLYYENNAIDDFFLLEGLSILNGKSY